MPYSLKLQKMKSMFTKLVLLSCIALLLADCAAARKNLNAIREKAQGSIYDSRELESEHLKSSRDILQEDFQETLQNELSASPFDKRRWGRDCDCM